MNNEIIHKVVDVLPSLRYHRHAIVASTSDNPFPRMQDIHSSDCEVHRSFGEGDLVAFLQEDKDKNLSFKHLVIVKLTSQMVVSSKTAGIVVSDATYQDNRHDIRVLPFNKIYGAADLNQYKNDQDVARKLRELDIPASNVFILPYEKESEFYVHS